MEEEKKSRDPFDGDYIGNIWGWKFSLFGLGLIVFLLGMMAYRHYTMDVPLGFEELEQTEIKADTLEVDE
jgi:hypothetical protein